MLRTEDKERIDAFFASITFEDLKAGLVKAGMSEEEAEGDPICQKNDEYIFLSKNESKMCDILKGNEANFTDIIFTSIVENCVADSEIIKKRSFRTKNTLSNTVKYSGNVCNMGGEKIVLNKKIDIMQHVEYKCIAEPSKIEGMHLGASDNLILDSSYAGAA